MLNNSLTRLALLFCVSVALGGQPARAQDAIRIGVVTSLSGPFAPAARDIVDGINAWVKGRGLGSRKVELAMADDETNPVVAANAYRRLADDPKVVMVMAMSISSAVLSMKAIASELKAPTIAAGAVDTIGRPADPWMFKIAPSGRDFMVVIINYAKAKGWKKLAILTGSDAQGQSDGKNLRELAAAAGIAIVAAETFNADETNFNTQVTRIRTANPHFIYDSATGRAAILSIKQFKQLGMTMPIVMTQAGISRAFFQGIGGASKADGLLTPTQTGSLGATAGAAAAQYYAELERALGHKPSFLDTFGYDAGLIAEAAIKTSDGSRKGIRDALEKFKDLPVLNGPVTFTANDHIGQDIRSIRMATLKDGLFLPAP